MRTWSERLLGAAAWTAGLGVPAALAVLLGFLAVRGTRGLALALPGAMGPGGLGPAAAGTLLLVAGSCGVAVPLGIAAGVHLAEGRGGRGKRLLRSAVELLASIPSILLGLTGFTALLLLRRTLAPGANLCLLLATLCLAVLVLPYVVVTTATALEGLPAPLRLLGPALGMGRWATLSRILLPAAGRGILAGVVLAVGRSAEDLAVILLTGAVANAGFPSGPGDRFEALPFRIYLLASDHRTPADLDRAFGVALLLLLLTTSLVAAAWALRRRLARRMEGRT